MCNPEFNFAMYYLHSDVFYPSFLDLTLIEMAHSSNL